MTHRRKRRFARRRWLQLAGLALAGCHREPEPLPPPNPPPPDRVVDRLTSLLTVAGLDWYVSLAPAELWHTSWLRPPLGRILEDERLDLLARTTGIDLRHAPALCLASHRNGGSIAYLVRHRDDALDVERRFRARLTGDGRRAVHGHQLVSVFGRIGTALRGMATIGRDVAVFQYGGDPDRGPVAIATLYARGKLRKIPTVLDDPVLAALHRALGEGPVELLWPGPFESSPSKGPGQSSSTGPSRASSRVVPEACSGRRPPSGSGRSRPSPACWPRRCSSPARFSRTRIALVPSWSSPGAI